MIYEPAIAMWQWPGDEYERASNALCWLFATMHAGALRIHPLLWILRKWLVIGHRRHGTPRLIRHYTLHLQDENSQCQVWLAGKRGTLFYLKERGEWITFWNDD